MAPLLEQEPLLRLPGPENTQCIPFLRMANPSARVLACTRVSLVGLVQLAGLEALLEPMQDSATVPYPYYSLRDDEYSAGPKQV